MLTLKLGDLLRAFSPNFDFKLAESIELKLADTIGLESIIRIDAQNHFHFPITLLPDGLEIEDATGRPRFHTAQALLLPAIRNTGDGGTTRQGAAVVALSSERLDKVSHQSAPLPFRQCAHYHINQPGWWDTDEQIVFGGTRIVPIKLGTPTEVFRPYQSATRSSFWAQIDAAGELGLQFPRASGIRDGFQLVTHAVPLRMKGRIEVLCTRHESTNCVMIGDQDHTVFSFDPSIVSVVWLVNSHDTRFAQTERYLLVGCDNDSH